MHSFSSSLRALGHSTLFRCTASSTLAVLFCTALTFSAEANPIEGDSSSAGFTDSEPFVIPTFESYPYFAGVPLDIPTPIAEPMPYALPHPVPTITPINVDEEVDAYLEDPEGYEFVYDYEDRDWGALFEEIFSETIENSSGAEFAEFVYYGTPTPEQQERLDLNMVCRDIKGKIDRAKKRIAELKGFPAELEALQAEVARLKALEAKGRLTPYGKELLVEKMLEEGQLRRYLNEYKSKIPGKILDYEQSISENERLYKEYCSTTAARPVSTFSAGSAEAF